MAQASKAIIPKDSGGPFGKRVGVTVSAPTQNGDPGLIVGAYVTGRVSSTDWDRYSLVVLNRECRVSLPLNLVIAYLLLQNMTVPMGRHGTRHLSRRPFPSEACRLHTRSLLASRRSGGLLRPRPSMRPLVPRVTSLKCRFMLETTRDRYL
jgi:hypothetical protein